MEHNATTSSSISTSAIGASMPVPSVEAASPHSPPSTSRISRHSTSSGEHDSGSAPDLRFWRFVTFFFIFLGGAGQA
jgi:hypothetical protein